MSEYAFGILNWLGNRTYQGKNEQLHRQSQLKDTKTLT